MKNERNKLLILGTIFIIEGIIVLVKASGIYLKINDPEFVNEFITLLLEPAGWFLFWEGLNIIIFETNKNSEKKPSNNTIKNVKRSPSIVVNTLQANEQKNDLHINRELVTENIPIPLMLNENYEYHGFYQTSETIGSSKEIY